MAITPSDLDAMIEQTKLTLRATLTEIDYTIDELRKKRATLAAQLGKLTSPRDLFPKARN